MKPYLVRYKGLWMGGKAIVFANNESEAVEKVRGDSATIDFTNIQCEELPCDGVIYNDNGNY